eukprot:TRINITY_DN9217_c0_g3_i3.p1 TRINITY_DN9217_c0_g3~~TRINITY_DN9217_c0_g3_i3.p1  ORF type:complete len:229 (+),score=51.75 TRINITY_DN9217_c0_g3_i3:114-800(+)
METNVRKSGLRVAHDVDDFALEREVVLTLKDTPVIEGDAPAADQDILENVELASKFRTEFLNRQKAKMRRPAYDPAAKYDQTEEEERPDPEGFTLDESGEYNLEKIQKREAIRAKLNKSETRGSKVSLDTQKVVASEYYTREEMDKFPKPKPNLLKKRRGADLSDLFKDMGDEVTPGTLGTHEAAQAKARAEARAEEEARKSRVENYATALEAAKERTSRSQKLEERS